MTDDLSNPLSDRLRALGEVPPAELSDARVALHWAAQAVAAFGFSAVPAREDYSHTILHWSDALQALLSEPQPESGLRAALHPVAFALSLRREDQELSRFELSGRTLDEAYAWLGEALAQAGRPLSGEVTRPGHLGDMPAHPVGEGKPFTAPPEPARRELARWLAASRAVVQAAIAGIPGMGPVQLWPHHFDTAALHVLEGEGENMRSVGVGVSPGDGTYAQPYVYVTPWPYPEGELPALPWGRWHTEGWTGAVLEGQALVSEDASTRASRLMEMILAAHRHGAAKREQGSKA